MADDEVTPLTTSTTNYGWIKPDVGASDDAWGGLLNSDLDSIDTTVKSVSNAIPLASSTTPAMDGVATIGTGTTWARADHVHPLASQVIGDNRIINGNFAINQRAYVSGTALATTVYGHDRWKAGPSGCTYTFTAALPDTTITITANTLTQVIEAGIIEGGVYTLSWTGTAQARVYQGTPTGSYAASPVTTASLTAGTNTIVEFNTGTVTRVKLEIGSVVTPFNRQSLAKSLADCQRYFWKPDVVSNILYASGFNDSATSFISVIQFPVTMRTAPTVGFSAGNTFQVRIATGTTVTGTAISAPTISASAAQINLTAASGLTAGQGGSLRDVAGGSSIQISAEL